MPTSASAPVAPETGAPLRQFARRHPVTLYLLLVFGLGVPLMFVPVLAARGVIPGGSLPAAVGLDTERARPSPPFRSRASTCRSRSSTASPRRSSS